MKYSEPRAQSAPVEPPPRNTIRLKIEGLRMVHDGSEDDVFELDDVVTIDFDWMSVAEQLKASGIPERDAHMYADEFSELVFQRELARTFAARCKRR